jgi:two-component system phosphate regulon sensor histidine kinase PhoR
MRSLLKVFLIIYIPIAVLLGITWNYTNKMTIKTAKAELIEEMHSKVQLLKGYPLKETFDRKIHDIFSKISKESRLRITVIRKDGVVVDDSYYSEPEIYIMENHSNRPEIVEAFEKGVGDIQRRSTTTEQNMYYYAAKYNDNIVVRISYPMSYIDTLYQNMIKHNVTVFFFLMITVGLLAVYLARRLSTPIQQLSLVADKIEAGEENIYFPSFKDKTLTKLVSVIYRIYSSMNAKTVELEQEKQKLSHIFSILDEGIILLDNKNNVKHFNPTAVNYLGINLFENENILKSIQKSLRSKIYEVYVRIFKEEKLVAFFDVTERAEYESFKTELIGNITHELKTPLAMIMGYSETIMNDPEMDKTFHDKFIKIIYNSSNRLNILINDILKLHKLEMQNQDLTVEEPVFLDELTDELEAYYNDHPQKVSMMSKQDEIYVVREHFVSVITNLVDNAIKYSTGENINVDFEHAEDKIKILVSDEGPAIPIDEKERIFERFYTMEKSKNQNTTGTGLGLSIVKHIATLYNGSVEIKNNEKGGNTFIVVMKEKQATTDIS